jgi:TetR/AcrR family transcriptional regulator, ethionamide resistance regulator
VGEVAPLPRLPERRRRPAGEERRLQILEAMEELLGDRPLAEISVADIAAAAGVARSGFYFYFANKGAVVSALLADVFAEMLPVAVAHLEADDAPPDRIGRALWATWQTWREHQVLVLAMLDARGEDPAVRELWDAWLDRFVAPVAAAIETQRAAGRAAPGPPAADLVTTLIAANERIFERLSRHGAGTARIEDALEALISVWVSTLYGSTHGGPTTTGVP